MDDVDDNDLLLPFERHILREPYSKYARVKRNNRFATMQELPKIWNCYALLDAICERELQDLKQVIDANVLLPLSLFICAFFRTRIAFELGFSRCIGESADLMRGAIEYAIHGKTISERPQLAEVWLSKDKGKEEFNSYREAFEREKKHRLFQGEDALYNYWTQFSERGSHSTKAALALRLRIEEGEGFAGSVELFEVDRPTLADFLLTLIDAARRLELIIFDCFRFRLDLDPELSKMRRRFGHARREAEVACRLPIQPSSVVRSQSAPTSSELIEEVWST